MDFTCESKFFFEITNPILLKKDSTKKEGFKPVPLTCLRLFFFIKKKDEDMSLSLSFFTLLKETKTCVLRRGDEREKLAYSLFRYLCTVY